MTIVKRTLGVLLAVALVGAFYPPTEVQAQEPSCYDKCEEDLCGGLERGIGPQEGTNKDICSAGGCSQCEAQEEEDLQMASALAGLETAETTADLSALANAHGDRLVLNASREMVLVMGGCTVHSPRAFVYVTEDQIRDLDALGIRSYGQYLADSAADALELRD